MRNHESRPPGTAPFPKVNAAHFHQTKRERSPDPSRGHGSGRGRYFNQGDRLAINNDPQHQQCKKKGEDPQTVSRKNIENRCYRCEAKGHWSRIFHTPKHLVNIYQASLKKTDNDVEANFISEDNVKPMKLDASDFFTIPKGYVNHPVDDEYEIV
ncbi:uncharacterized protein LOC107876588 [Capsicum annuum]|uniref:uncharacterized protein LOC107876588 n=1 Tax=Capsicum annuum TaxID=4072 RepID=UPI0007BF3A96|nr:uncharacterized protein LOC107876588 [Capsicum annuum]